MIINNVCVCVCQHFFELRLREQERIIHYYLREGGRGQGLKTCFLTIKSRGKIPPIPSGPSRYLLSIKILFRIAHVNRSLVIRFSFISLHFGNKIIVMNNKPT